MFTIGLLIVVGMWEGYKALADASGHVHLLGFTMPARADDSSMPHVSAMLSRFTRPEHRGDSTYIWQVVLGSAWYSFRLALAGLLAGAVVGLGLALLMQRFVTAQRAMTPYIIASQTVPLIAIAPLVAGWQNQLSIGPLTWEPWMSVAFIAAYLAFFPVSLGALRGLQSPNEASLELMQSYAAGWWPTVWKVRLPASVPFVVPALKLASAAAIVGAIVAEISIGLRGGIGRLIIEYSTESTSDPAKVFTALIGAAVLGLVMAGAVAGLDVFAMKNRQRESTV